MKVIDVPCNHREKANSSFIAGVNPKNGYFTVSKNRLNGDTDRGYMSKYHIRKTLKKLSKLGYGSKTWLIYEI